MDTTPVEETFLTPLTNVVVEGNDFNLLQYMNMDDYSLMAHLGIESGDPHFKLLDPNASNYSDLVPPQPDSVTYNPMTQEQTTYYAIDTEPPQGIVYDAVLLNDASSPVNVGDLFSSSNVLTPETDLEQHITLAPTENLESTETPMIIISADQHERPVSTIEIQLDSPAVPSSSALSSTSATPVAPKGKDLKRCGRRRQSTVEASKAAVAAAEPAKAKPSRRRRPKTTKKYEIIEQLNDPLLEKKRLNAINAKTNRDKKKNMLRDLSDKVESVTNERDALQREVEELKKRERQLREQLMAKFGVQLPTI